MKVVVQRVSQAEVKVEGRSSGKIDQGYLLLVGFKETDTSTVVEKIAEKIVNLRVFSDDAGKMNLAIKDVGGQILSVPQFTLYADVTSGRRPSFSGSAPADQAQQLFEYFNECLRELDVIVESGVFQAEMAVELLNDGPVTLLFDSEDFT